MKFELSFLEAMKVVLDGGAVQGENFKWGCYLTARDGVVILNEFKDDKGPEYFCYGNMHISKGTLEQKYRIVSVCNRAGLYHN